MSFEARERFQHLRAFATLAQNLVSVLSIYRERKAHNDP